MDFCLHILNDLLFLDFCLLILNDLLFLDFCLLILIDFLILDFREIKLLFWDKFGDWMVLDRREEVIIKICENYECQEIHKNFHDGIVGVEDDNVDDLDKDDQDHLKETT